MEVGGPFLAPWIDPRKIEAQEKPRPQKSLEKGEKSFRLEKWLWRESFRAILGREGPPSFRGGLSQGQNPRRSSLAKLLGRIDPAKTPEGPAPRTL